MAGFQQKRSEITLAQLRIFWAVAHAHSLTKAAKQLNLTQPSLSQQLSNLEVIVGTRLFDRGSNGMELTDAGRFLLRRAEVILGGMDEAEAGLREFVSGGQGAIRIAGLNSVLRVLLPPAAARLSRAFPQLELDVHEVGPNEAIELLYGRRVDVALVASSALAASSAAIHQTPIARDPYVLAVPKGLDLALIRDPDSQLGEHERRVVNNCIEFSFGTQHSLHIEQWYRRVLPHSRRVAQCRSYEVALSMVQAGLGICLVPAFAARTEDGQLAGLTLYRAHQPSRQLVAAIPAQYSRISLYSGFIAALREAGSDAMLPTIRSAPPFFERALEAIV